MSRHAKHAFYRRPSGTVCFRRVSRREDNNLRSKRFRASSSRKLGQEQKKMNDGGGGGERRKRLSANPTILKKSVRPRMQLLIGAVRVLLIT